MACCVQQRVCVHVSLDPSVDNAEASKVYALMTGMHAGQLAKLA
jgi:hypothetical protein